jgi:trigger factor
LLKVTTEPLEKCQVLMTIEVDDAEADQLLKAAARRISSQVQIPGFRPGKAPYALVVRRFGEEVIREEALEDLTGKVFREALKQANLEPFAPATMEEVNWQPLVMKVRVPLEPKVELDDYRALRLEPVSVEITEEEIDQALAELQAQYASWETVERPARAGDRVEADVRIEIGNVSSSREGMTLLVRSPDESTKYAAISNAMIGMSAGEERTITLPAALFLGDEEGYEEGEEEEEHEVEEELEELVENLLDDLEEGEGAETPGGEATVRIKVHAVQEGHIYPLDDDFAQMVGEFNTLQELREKVRESLIQKKKAEIEREQTAQAVERIINEMAHAEWPPVLEESAIDRWVSGLEQSLKQNGMPLETYLRIQQKSLEQLREEMRPQVQKQLHRSLVLQEIARREGISVEPDEVLRSIEMMAMMAQSRGEKLPSSISQGALRQIFQDLLDIKVYARLSDILKGKAQEFTPEQPTAAQEATQSPEEKTSETSPEASSVEGELSIVSRSSEEG